MKKAPVFLEKYFAAVSALARKDLRKRFPIGSKWIEWHPSCSELVSNPNARSETLP